MSVYNLVYPYLNERQELHQFPLQGAGRWKVGSLGAPGWQTRALFLPIRDQVESFASTS